MAYRNEDRPIRTMMTQTLETSAELKSFGEKLSLMNMALESAENHCRGQYYDMMFTFVHLATEQLSEIDKIAKSVSSERRRSYDTLRNFARDTYASAARKILNKYCNKENVR